MKKSILLASFIGLSLFGFGCRKPEPTQPQVPNAVAPINGVTQTPGTATPVEPGISRDVLYARQVLRNLSQATAFRASMVVPSAGGIINTVLDYNRVNGLIGRVTLPTDAGPQTAELFANDTEIWFREGTSTWQNLSNTEEGQSFKNIFQNAFGYQGQYQSTVADNAKLVSKDEDTSANCTRHAFTQTLNTGSEQHFTLCVARDLPVYLTIEGPFGQIEVRYRDVNGNVEVKKPV
ncbi:hypothetical protein M0Q28_03505 [Patescibacteria group bacterium]|jgi:hypothetical protein|nr:hypothetical protein [Patescibacteria group bacterium]